MTAAERRVAAQDEARSIEIAIAQARERIDALGETIAQLTGDDRPDMLACYASNVTQGASALLREMAALLPAPAQPRRGKRG